MNRLILVLIFGLSVLMTTGCVTETVYYTPGYNPHPHYVYAVKYYNGGPYWDDSYYYGYDDLGDVGYWGMYDSYNAY